MNPQNYASLKYSKKLADKEIVLETEFFWTLLWGTWKICKVNIAHSIPAPSMAEVWRELKGYIDIGTNRRHKILSFDNGVSYAEYYRLDNSRFYNVNPTDALIDLLIWVKENEK